MSAGTDSAPRILVAGIGNIFLGDDGFGSEVARVLAASPLPDDVQVTDYGIRGMHLAYDLLVGYDALVLVDTVPNRGSPGTIHVLEVGPDDLGEGELDAHGMQPTAVLASLGRLGGALPRTIVVGCEPATVEEQIGLSAPVAAAVEPAAATVRALLAQDLSVDMLRRKEHR
ncbi:MAG: hydrogenase maturation protease [Sporichthyaceae bacterium]